MISREPRYPSSAPTGTRKRDIRSLDDPWIQTARFGNREHVAVGQKYRVTQKNLLVKGKMSSKTKGGIFLTHSHEDPRPVVSWLCLSVAKALTLSVGLLVNPFANHRYHQGTQVCRGFLDQPKSLNLTWDSKNCFCFNGFKGLYCMHCVCSPGSLTKAFQAQQNKKHCMKM